VKINTLAFRLAVLATCIALPGLAVAGSPTDWVQGTVLEVKNTLAIQDSGLHLSRSLTSLESSGTALVFARWHDWR
jgi:hypothetical protein